MDDAQSFKNFAFADPLIVNKILTNEMTDISAIRASCLFTGSIGTLDVHVGSDTILTRFSTPSSTIYFEEGLRKPKDKSKKPKEVITNCLRITGGRAILSSSTVELYHKTTFKSDLDWREIAHMFVPHDSSFHSFSLPYLIKKLGASKILNFKQSEFIRSPFFSLEKFFVAVPPDDFPRDTCPFLRSDGSPAGEFFISRDSQDILHLNIRLFDGSFFSSIGAFQTSEDLKIISYKNKLISTLRSLFRKTFDSDQNSFVSLSYKDLPLKSYPVSVAQLNVFPGFLTPRYDLSLLPPSDATSAFLTDFAFTSSCQLKISHSVDSDSQGGEWHKMTLVCGLAGLQKVLEIRCPVPPATNDASSPPDGLQCSAQYTLRTKTTTAHTQTTRERSNSKLPQHFDRHDSKAASPAFSRAEDKTDPEGSSRHRASQKHGEGGGEGWRLDETTTPIRSMLKVAEFSISHLDHLFMKLRRVGISPSSKVGTWNPVQLLSCLTGTSTSPWDEFRATEYAAQYGRVTELLKSIPGIVSMVSPARGLMKAATRMEKWAFHDLSKNSVWSSEASYLNQWSILTLVEPDMVGMPPPAPNRPRTSDFDTLASSPSTIPMKTTMPLSPSEVQLYEFTRTFDPDRKIISENGADDPQGEPVKPTIGRTLRMSKVFSASVPFWAKDSKAITHAQQKQQQSKQTDVVKRIISLRAFDVAFENCPHIIPANIVDSLENISAIQFKPSALLNNEDPLGAPQPLFNINKKQGDQRFTLISSERISKLETAKSVFLSLKNQRNHFSKFQNSESGNSGSNFSSWWSWIGGHESTHAPLWAIGVTTVVVIAVIILFLRLIKRYSTDKTSGQQNIWIENKRFVQKQNSNRDHHISQPKSYSPRRDLQNCSATAMVFPGGERRQDEETMLVNYELQHAMRLKVDGRGALVPTPKTLKMKKKIQSMTRQPFGEHRSRRLDLEQLL